MSVRRRLGRALASVVLSEEQLAQLAKVRVDDAGHGWDRFGMSPAGVEFGLTLARHLHDRYFRVDSHGADNIPKSGPTIVASNHSGMLPMDGLMVWADILLNTDPPRVPRPVADFFVPGLPVISTVLARAGVISGSRGNVRAALDAGDLLALFPEGVRGIGKPYSQRYQLQRWTVGHAELAIRHGATIVPTAVIGAEESWPQVAKLETFNMFGIPYLPIPATPLPLPARFHIHYGDPIVVAGDYAPADADDPAAVHEASERVRDAVACLIAHGLSQRKGVFR